MSKAEQMRGLKSGKGIQHLLDKGYKILGNPLVVFDTDYRLIAHTDVPVDDPLWKELITTGTFCMETQRFFTNECFTDDVANAKKLAIMKSDRLKYDRIGGHIVNGHGIKVANVLMIESNKAFEPDTVAAFDTLVDLLSKEIGGDASYIAYGEAYQNAWINRLIDYDFEDKGLYSPHVQILYNGFKANLYLAVVDIAQSGARHHGHQYFVDLLRRKRKDFKYAIYDQYVLMILSTDHKPLSIKKEMGALAKYFEQENIFVGISSCFDNLFALRTYYAEAVQALSGATPNGNSHIFLYQTRGVD